MQQKATLFARLRAKISLFRTEMVFDNPPKVVTYKKPFRCLPLLCVSLLVAPISFAGTDQPCLALSPLRALPIAHQDTLKADFWRDRLIDSLDSRLSPMGWSVAPAGGCVGNAVLDAFQNPEDYVVDGTDTSARLRLEWHDHPGAVILFLDSPQNPEQFLGLWAKQIASSSRAHMSHVQIGTNPVETEIRITRGKQTRLVPLTERSQLDLPPGQWTFTFEKSGFAPQVIDTVMQAGQDLQLDIQLAMQSATSRKLPAWPVWVASGTTLGAALWFAIQQSIAQDRYSSLDSTASSTTFESRWKDLRNANLARNWLLGAGLGLGGVAVYLQF